MINNIATINKNPIEISKGIGGFTFHGEGERWLGRKSDSCAIEIKRLSPSLDPPSPRSVCTDLRIATHVAWPPRPPRFFDIEIDAAVFTPMSPDSCYRVSTDWNGIPPQELDRTLKSSLPQFIVSSDCRLVIFFFFLIFENRIIPSFSHILFFSLFAMWLKMMISVDWYICFSFFLFIVLFISLLFLIARNYYGGTWGKKKWSVIRVVGGAFTAITCNFDVLRLTLWAMNARTFNAPVNADNWGLLDPLWLIPWPVIVLLYLISVHWPSTQTYCMKFRKLFRLNL